jgi:CheY-like chemotaxis protein
MDGWRGPVREDRMAARILVADDSVTIQKVVELTFSKEDFVLIPARSGEEAIRKAKEVPPDLILLDLVMPDKNGYEVCAALREEPMLRAVPVIMLTGTFEAFDRDQGLRAGANDFVTKPFESQALITKVRQLLAARTLDMGPPPAATPKGPPPPAPPRVGGPPAAPPKSASVDTPPAAPGPASPGPASLVLPPPMAARAGDLSTLELPALEIESTQVAPEAGGADASRLPEGLSLEELLEAAPQPPPGPGSAGETAPERAPAPIPLDGLVPESEPVFDLTADMQGPSLPLVEVGSGEPPALSVEDHSSQAEAAPDRAAAVHPPELPPLDGLVPESEPVFDLTADMQGPSLPLVEVGSGEPPALSVEDLLRPPGPTPLEAGAGEVPEVQHEPVVEPPSAQPGTPATSHGPADIGALVDAAAAAFPASAAPLMAEVLAPPAPAGEAESQGEQAPPVAGVALEMGSLRQAVTERVAHELAKELSGRLIERIEGIVWEVVPDLAEILINREIERIRAMAEGKQPS